MNASALDYLAKIEAAQDLPTLPAVITFVLQQIRDPNTSAQDIGRAVSSDVALSSKVLRIVNSAFYGFGGRISTMTQAVVILGFNTIKSAILGVSVINSLRHIGHSIALDKEDFWRHSIATAASARTLCYRVAPMLAEEAFIAGILHGSGLLLIDQFGGDEIERVLARAQREEIPVSSASQLELGFSTADLGAALMHRWNFPENLVSVVRHVPLSEDLPELSEESLMLTAAVHYGRIFAMALSLGEGGEVVIPRRSIEAGQLLRLRKADIDTLMNDSLEAYGAAAMFLTD